MRPFLSCIVVTLSTFVIGTGNSWSQTAAEKSSQPAAAVGTTQPAPSAPAPAKPTLGADEEFFCPMHPGEVRAKLDATGAVSKCPICGMVMTKRGKVTDPTGSWKWQFEGPDNTLDLVLKLKWDGKKVEGKYTGFNSTTKVEDSKLEKDALSFVVRPDFNGQQMEVKFNGKVAKDEIKGKIGVDFGGEPQEFDWVAKRYLDTDDVVGVWEIKTETPDGNEFQSTLTVTKDDKGLHAKTASDFGEFEAKNVKIKDNDFTFEISNDNADFAFKSVYHSTPRGNAVEGKSEYDFGGNTGEMKFTGKRLPPKEEKKAEPAGGAAGKAATPGDGKQETKQPAAAATKSDGK